MPPATKSSARSAKTGLKSAGGTSARRAGAAARARTATKVKAKAKRTKAARARAASQTRSSARPTGTATRWAAAERSNGAFGDYAERAVLIPVGVALTARDRVVSGVSETIATYSSPTRTQAQLRRFERRGATARKRLEREVRKTRVRVERDLRQRRREIEKTVSDIEGRRDAVAKNGGELANRVPELANRVQERILSLV